MRTVTLGELRCLEAEDIFAADECRLEIVVDAEHRQTMRRSLSKNIERSAPSHKFVDSDRRYLRYGKTTTSASGIPVWLAATGLRPEPIRAGGPLGATARVHRKGTERLPR